ncbi:MAG: polyhydroxyalkanoic acid system family protein [Pirellulaceae bacterium]
MVPIQISVRHQLGQQAAKLRVQQFLDSLQREYANQISDVQGDWDNDRLQFGFHISGLSIACTLDVEENQVQVRSSLPLAAVLFRGKIEGWIREELEHRLA